MEQGNKYWSSSRGDLDDNYALLRFSACLDCILWLLVGRFCVIVASNAKTAAK